MILNKDKGGAWPRRQDGRRTFIVLRTPPSSALNPPGILLPWTSPSRRGDTKTSCPETGEKKKSEARVRSRGSGGLTESRPQRVAGNIGGLGRGRDPPGQTRGEGPGLPLARCLLPALLRPPHLPNAKDEAQSRRARRGRERPRPRTQEGPSGPGGLRPASGHEEKPRAPEARSPVKKRNPLQQILGGGSYPPSSLLHPPLPGRKAEAQSRDVGIGPDRGGGSEGRVPSPRRPRTEVLGRGVSIVTETRGGALTL
ncbi:hypothetical protein NDU88_003780 [Pleurodeles waltl]|uniref:Uncharacterized protein n=1 Tax=Pleurodeles waltl TaxID=8319 RepID=A0AAV7SGY9_PLEWA|nr:hypothetical protein NDU88_003780 [Pleurodeles waltl]